MNLRHQWTEAEIRSLQRLYPDTKTSDIAERLGLAIHQVYGKAAQLGLKKSDAYLASPAACRLRRGDNVGKATRFQKGLVPFNKGRKGVTYDGCVATQFKKGHKPRNWVPIGSERLSKEGYLQRKMTDTGYPPRDWVAVHHLIWKSAGREIPPSHALRFKDGNKQNITLDNLELIPRRELMKRNSVHNYGPEIAALHQLRGAITRQINRRSDKNA